MKKGYYIVEIGNYSKNTSGSGEIYYACKACATHACTHGAPGTASYPAQNPMDSCELGYEGICEDR